MDAELWQRVKEVVAAALELPPAERGAFLDRACAGDPELRREVESFLAADDPSSDFIEQPFFGREADNEDGTPARERIGPYRLLSRMGEGGMGIVFLAVRDEGYEQRVAIKLVKRGMDTEEILGRFHYERQILANLTHPDIARLLDGGTTDDGLPYFVMEQIDGEPIDRYCAERNLTIAERLTLFVRVCEAVRFAHQNLVVHRDLKPGNILVTAAGEPKLLDFGIAKVLDAGASEQTRTRFMLPATPQYASPEQLAGQQVTTASDVYSLGVVLYELLAGRRPFADEEGREPPLTPALVDRLPRRPSTAVGRQEADGSRREELLKRRRQLAGDLDAIVLKALRPEVSERYSSVEQLIDDLNRYREGRPVEARKGSFTYRASKFVRRNRGRFAAGAVAALLLLGLTWAQIQNNQQQRELDEQRRLFDLESELSDKFGDFLIDLLSAADPLRRGSKPFTVQSLLERGTTEIHKRFKEDPLIKSAFLGAMGQVYRRQGAFNLAEPMLRESLELRSAELPEDHHLVALARNNLASVLLDKGFYTEAFDQLTRALESLHRQPEPDFKKIAPMMNNLALAHLELDQVDRAVELYREALAMKESHPDLFSASDVVLSQISLGGGLEAQGKVGEAEELYRQALARAERAAAVTRSAGEEESEAFSGVLSRLAAAQSHLGSLLRDRRDFAAARPLLASCLENRRQVYVEDHLRIADVKRELARLEQRVGDFERAAALYDETLAIQRHRLDPDHPDIAITLHDDASLLLATGDFVGAAEEAAQAAQIFRERLPVGHRRIRAVEALEREIRERSR